MFKTRKIKTCKMKLIKISTLGIVLTAGSLHSQVTTVVSNDFNVSQGATFTTAGQIGTSGWNVNRSGEDWGARIDNNILELTNTASDAANANGWVYANTGLASTGNFNTTLSNSAGLVTWTFNMRQFRTNPAGFNDTNSYGAAFVIGSTSTTVASEGDGYAIVLGNSGTPDPIRFVSFTGGIQSLGTANSGLITAGSPLENPTTSYMSLQLTYNPTNNLWSLFGRNDGASDFADPRSGTLDSLGTATDSTHTGTALTSLGAYWQGSTAANNTAFFDNVVVTAIPEPSVVILFGLGLAFVLWRMRATRRQTV